MMSVRTEKKLLGQFVDLYRELPCLWDITHPLYTNKEAREKAFELLLEKYKIVYDDATIDNVKRRLENMRCCFRREHRKVIAARVEGGPEYEPVLWYYKSLLFLQHVADFSRYEAAKPSPLDEDDEESDDPPPTPIKRSKLSSIFITENLRSENENEHEATYNSYDNEPDKQEIRVDGEAASFGRTLGVQLDGLQPTQRYIAEKLISEVIFYARMERLRPEASINLNENCLT